MAPGSRYVGLTLPHVLGREPYGEATKPTEKKPDDKKPDPKKK